MFSNSVVSPMKYSQTGDLNSSHKPGKPSVLPWEPRCASCLVTIHRPMGKLSSWTRSSRLHHLSKYCHLVPTVTLDWIHTQLPYTHTTPLPPQLQVSPLLKYLLDMNPPYASEALLRLKIKGTSRTSTRLLARTKGKAARNIPCKVLNRKLFLVARLDSSLVEFLHVGP